MYERSQKRQFLEYKFIAKMHGCELKDPDGFQSNNIDDINYNGDPESVAHLSDEQKEALTQKLMSQFKAKTDGLHGIGT